MAEVNDLDQPVCTDDEVIKLKVKMAQTTLCLKLSHGQNYLSELVKPVFHAKPPLHLVGIHVDVDQVAVRGIGDQDVAVLLEAHS